MGGISSLMSRFRSNHECRILMVGLDAAGKTTILYKLNLGTVETTIPTIGFNVEHVEYAGRSKIVNFTAWDVGGRDKIRPLWRHYYRHVNALIFVVDSNDRDRIEDAKDQLDSLLSEDEVENYPLLVFANKQDLPTSMKPAEVVEKLGLHGIRGRKWFIAGSVATRGEGLYEGLEWLTETVERSGTEASGTSSPQATEHLPTMTRGKAVIDKDDVSTADTEDEGTRADILRVA
eukprot:TRINITY_DN1781_c1_g1_i2.p1 TRINITY_DN1781_c1_g1~~TRINITY_DN1781_c1_g1_i2.p1  ORF type:complete len:233 (-),score=41.92 TRINITY_DN1781_c1_g1_i2:175-873(-)